VRCLWGRSSRPAFILREARRCPVLWGRAVPERVESYRLYSCRGCNMSVSIFGRCDRGNIYCALACAALARRRSCRRAGARYQRTRQGARQHAARQQVWRKRQRDKVTHQGCAPNGSVFTMPITVDATEIESEDVPPAPNTTPSPPSRHRHGHRVVGRCDFCHAPLPLFTRLQTRRGWAIG
jgi:hypothetical protein